MSVGQASAMAIHDAYVVQYLLQSTREVPSHIRWREGESGAYLANIRGVEVELGQALNTDGPRNYIALTHDWEKVFIVEPRSVAVFRKRYETEEQQRLAKLMKELSSAVSRQCAAGQPNAEQVRQRRERIYRQLLFDCQDNPAESRG